MWGWTIAPERAYELLDAFYALGGRAVDMATNYPINQQPNDFRKAEGLLANWCQVNGVNDLKVMIKVGSVNNMRTPEHNLSASFLLLCASEYRQLFGENLQTFMIHWDNRADVSAIRETVAVLSELHQSGLAIGLSGIRYPAVYAEVLPDFDLPTLAIQLKHNLLYSDFDRYAPLHARASFIAYGVNAGGLKLEQEEYREDATLGVRGGQPQGFAAWLPGLRQVLASAGRDAAGSRPVPTTMNHLGMLYAAYHPGIDQLLLGASRPAQLQDSWNWLQALRTFDYTDVYNALVALTHQYRTN